MSTTHTSPRLAVLIAGFIIGANAAALNLAKVDSVAEASTAYVTPTERITLGFNALSAIRNKAADLPRDTALYTHFDENEIITVAHYIGDYNMQVRETCNNDKLTPLSLDMTNQRISIATSSFIKACRGYL